MELFNPYQPIRDRHTEDGKVLQFATMPKKGKKTIFICTRLSAMTQCRLYRAVKQQKFGKQVAIGDLYDYCFFDVQEEVSKTQMGYIFINSVIYEPRLLVNNSTVGKPTMTYTIRDLREVEYGLEWMICTWLRKFLNENAPPEEAIQSREQMADELDILGNSDHTEYLDVYESNFKHMLMPEPDWAKITALAKEYFPPAPKRKAEWVQPSPPRDLSKL